MCGLQFPRNLARDPSNCEWLGGFGHEVFRLGVRCGMPTWKFWRSRSIHGAGLPGGLRGLRGFNSRGPRFPFACHTTGRVLVKVQFGHYLVHKLLRFLRVTRYKVKYSPSYDLLCSLGFLGALQGVSSLEHSF